MAIDSSGELAAGTELPAVATVDVPARDGLVVVWHAFDPPRTAAALAAAVPMTGVPVWRVYLSPPVPDPAEHDYLEVLGAFALAILRLAVHPEYTPAQSAP